MIAKLYFPISETSNLNFDTDVQMSDEEYFNAIADNTYSNEGAMRAFEQGYINQGYKNPYMKSYERRYSQDEKTIECDAFGEMEVSINDYNGKIVDENYFQDLVDSQKMTMLTISFNPNSDNYNALAEIHYWIGDSNLISNDNTLNNRAKMAALPGRSVKLKTPENKTYALNNCKILQDISDKKTEPIKIITIVEKIENI